jgi:hypothetical protein
VELKVVRWQIGRYQLRPDKNNARKNQHQGAAAHSGQLMVAAMGFLFS